MTVPWPDDAVLLKPGEVHHALRVDPRTIRNWEDAGVLTSIRLPSGHRRYHRAPVEAILNIREWSTFRDSP